MCQRITCQSCGRPSFTGCGRHVENVLGDVAPADRCQCGSTTTKTPAAGISGMGILQRMADFLKGDKGRRNNQ